MAGRGRRGRTRLRSADLPPAVRWLPAPGGFGLQSAGGPRPAVLRAGPSHHGMDMTMRDQGDGVQMTWGNLFKRANSYAQAAAEARFDAHADPKVQLEQVIGGLQEHHRDLEAAASQVLAQEKIAKLRLADLSEQEAKYTKLALAAKQHGDLEVARTFAAKIAGLRDQIQGLAAQIPQLEQAANDAREAVQESADQLQQKMNERDTILAQVDQANMQRQMAASLQQVADLTKSGDTPSFDEVKRRVADRFAQAQAATELRSSSPEALELRVHHAELTSQADDILAQLDAGTLQPAALTVGSDDAVTRSTRQSTPAEGERV